MHRRLTLFGTLFLLASLSGCGFVGTIGGGTGGVNAAGGQNVAGGGAGTIAGIPGFGIPLQQIPVPAQPGGFAGSGSGP